MGVKDKAVYLTALFRLLPFGVLALYYGIHGIVYKTSTENLIKIRGEIVFAGMKSISSGTTGICEDVYVVQISDNRYDTLEGYAYATVDIKALQVIEGAKGEEVVVWVDPEIDNQIGQVQYKNNLLIEFKGAYYLYLFFVIIGVIYTLITLIYLVKYPEHLFKRSDSPASPDK